MTDATPVTNTTVTFAPKPNPDTPPAPRGDEGKVTFTSEQQVEIDRIAANARRDGKQTGKTEAEQTIAAAKAAEDAERERKAAEARGEYDSVKAGLEKERDQASTERDGLKAERDEMAAAIAEALDGEWKALPDKVRDLYAGADTPLAKYRWLPKAKALAGSEVAQPRPGNGPSPRRIDGNGPTVEDTKNELRNSGAYAF